MAKRRKQKTRISRDIPHKSRLLQFADALWSLSVRRDWGCCVVCKQRGKLDAHHIICRAHDATRYDLRNGICLCANHHRWDADTSPHQNPEGWLRWLRANQPSLHGWYMEKMDTGDHRRFDGIKTADYYIQQIQRLRQYVEPEDFSRICGVRFAAYLEMP